MNLIDQELVKAEIHSAEARQQLARTVVALQSRLKPSALAREALDDLKEAGGEIARSGVEALRHNPLPALGVATALTAFFARKPLARLFHRKPTDA